MEKVKLNPGLRKAANMTQDELAMKLGIDRSTVAKWESGDALPRAAMMPDIARALQCSMDDLLCRKSGEILRTGGFREPTRSL